jgi:magnesium chelatase family protein
MNPCPCGYLGHPGGRCRCTPDLIARYRGKISGPLLDRIDLQVEVGPVQHDELLAPGCGETSAASAKRVAHAATLQHGRQGKLNAALSGAEIDEYCIPDKRADALLRTAMTRLDWSARSYHRVLKTARTIADLSECSVIGADHVAEAVQCRRALGKRQD